MSTVAINRDGYAGRGAGYLRGHSHLVIQGLHFVPVDFQADQGTIWTVPFLGGESVASDECLLFEVHQLAEADFCWGIALRFDHGFFAGNIIDLDQDKAGFDAGDVEGYHAGGVNIEDLAFVHQFVPDADGVFPGHPDFKSEVSSIAGTRNVDGDARYPSMRHAKIFYICDIGKG